jgi:predicted nucleic acid-binding protein
LILYLDTSALVKLYVREAGSLAVRRETNAAEAVATSAVAFAEARAAFARLARERPASRKLHRRRVSQFDRDWRHYLVVELTPAVTRSSGEFAELHALRGFDAIHLASALWLRSAYSGDLAFMAYDRRLTAAAVDAGLRVPRG